MAYAVPRKRRKHPIIDKNGQLFSDAMHEKKFDLASLYAFQTVLEMEGVNNCEGIMNAMDNANSYIRRKSRRNGLL